MIVKSSGNVEPTRILVGGFTSIFSLFIFSLLPPRGVEARDPGTVVPPENKIL